MRKKDRSLVVEGYFDVITLAAMGFGETVAPMGTALTPQQVRRLKGQASRLVLVFDGDQAGRKRRPPLPAPLPGRGGAARGAALAHRRGPRHLRPGPGARGPGKGGHRQPVAHRGGAGADHRRGRPLHPPRARARSWPRAGGVIKAIGDPVSSWLYLGRLAARLGLPAEVAARPFGPARARRQPPQRPRPVPNPPPGQWGGPPVGRRRCCSWPWPTPPPPGSWPGRGPWPPSSTRTWWPWPRPWRPSWPWAAPPSRRR